MVVLAAVDGESAPDPVVGVGAAVASALDDDLVVLHVMPERQFEDRRQSFADSSLDTLAHYMNSLAAEASGRGEQAEQISDEGYFVDDAERDAEGVARAIATETVDEDADVSFLGRVGEPAEEVVRVADRRDARYVVIGGRKRSPVGKALFGSTVQSILLEADRPVVTVPEGGRAPDDVAAGPVVAAVDRTGESERIVREAWALADSLDRELHVLHVLGQDEFVEVETEGADRSGRPPSMDQVRSMAASVASEAASGVTDEFTAVGLVGRPSGEILKYADEHGASFIVAGGRKQSPFGKVLFGSVTQSVLLGADVPVVTTMGEE